MSISAPILESIRFAFKRSKRLFKRKKSKITFPITDIIYFGEKKATFTATNIHEWLHCLDPNYEKEVRGLFLSSIKKRIKPTVAVIGAAQGSYAIAAALYGAKVYAFEPDPKAFERLNINLYLNNEKIGNLVSAYPFIISDLDGAESIFFNPDESFAASLIHLDKLTEDRNVQAYKIDTLLQKGEIEPFEVLLIDAEGSEKKALEGMSNLLSSNRKPSEIFLELHPFFLEKFGSTPSEVCSILIQSGYRLKWSMRRKTEIHTLFTITE